MDQNKIYKFDNNGNNPNYSTLSQDVLAGIVNTYIDDVYNLYSGELPVYKDKSILQEEITNIIVNEDESETTNIISNVVENPTKEEQDIQNFINVNNRREEFNNKYSMNLLQYIGHKNEI